jgi:hypothetical protein
VARRGVDDLLFARFKPLGQRYRTQRILRPLLTLGCIVLQRESWGAYDPR